MSCHKIKNYFLVLLINLGDVLLFLVLRGCAGKDEKCFAVLRENYYICSPFVEFCALEWTQIIK